jgi:hypothetical protein
MTANRNYRALLSKHCEVKKWELFSEMKSEEGNSHVLFVSCETVE